MFCGEFTPQPTRQHFPGWFRRVADVVDPRLGLLGEPQGDLAVEAAARRSRRWLKVLLVLGVLGVVVLIVLKIRGGGEDTHAPADDDAAGSPSRSQT